MTAPARASQRDRGLILPLVLVVAVVLSLVVVSIARYATTTLRYGQVAEGRADRLSAAEGGIRDVLDRLDSDGTLCTTLAGAGGITIDVPTQINDADVEVDCRAIGSTLSNITGWAIAVTGNGASGPALLTQSGAGSDKVFGGPTYVNSLADLDLKAPLEVSGGHLWFTDPSCLEGGEYFSDGSGISNLQFDPPSRGVWCTSKTADELFSEPTVPGLGSLTVRNPGDYDDRGTCRVFEPGFYDYEPEWATYNYMKSGDYLFDLGGNPATATIEIRQATVTAGRQGVAGSQQVISNTACDLEREMDTVGGATFYLDGATHIDIRTQGSLEILRREQGTNPVDFVSVHALPSHNLAHSTPILSTASGNNKQLALHGQVYAPDGNFVFGNVTNVAAAQLLGGAVVGAIEAQASASASGFLIQVQGNPQSDRFQLTATAEKDGLSTAVRVVAQLRFTAADAAAGVGSWELAVNSWRVCPSASC